MDKKNLEEMLDKYARYQKGDESCKCELVVEDEEISGFHFNKSELGGSTFVATTFNICNFDNVYLSNSNFGGSKFLRCLINEGTLRKANWNCINASALTVSELNVFRTDFINSNFEKCIFMKSKFFKSNFALSNFDNVVFNNCHFELTSFEDCKFNNTMFSNCTFKDTNFDEGAAGVDFLQCRKI